MSNNAIAAHGKTRRSALGPVRLASAANWSLAHLAALLTLVGVLAVSSPTARADVTAVGDVTPSKANPDQDPNDPDDNQIPDLPQFGGATPGGILTVGGTDQYIGGTAAGTVVIDIPSDTLPLVSTRGIVGGNVSTNPEMGADGQGQVSVVSLNSAWRISQNSGTGQNAGLVIGRQGQGFLEVLAGARVVPGDATTEFRNDTNQLTMTVGDFEGSQGFVIVDGFSSLLKNREFTIGRRGYGSLSIANRGRVDTRQTATIGDESAGTASGNGFVQVDGLGTRWNIGDDGLSPTNNADLILGNSGRASIEVRNQAWVRVKRDTLFGTSAGGYGAATVTGQGSKLWTFGNMTVGQNATGSGVLGINDKGLVETNGTTTVGATSFINMGGGTLLTPTVNNSGVIRGDGRIEATTVNNLVGGDIRNAAATANLREKLVFTGSVVNNDNIESIGGEIEFQGLVTNNDEIYARDAILRFKGGLAEAATSRITLDNTVVETATFAPLTSNGAMAIGASDSSAVIGDLTLSGTNFLEMEIGQQSSHLDVTGTATLGGFLSVTASPTANLKSGDTFELITATGGVFGMPTLATLNIGGFAAMLSTSPVANPTSLFLTLTGAASPATQGDFNGDGNVDAADLAIILANFGAPPPPVTPSMGDADGDGDVDGNDIVIWQQNQGPLPAVAVSNANVGAVPEPATGLLLGLGLAGLGMRRRNKK